MVGDIVSLPSRIDRSGLYKWLKAVVTAATVTGGVQRSSIPTTARTSPPFERPPRARFFLVAINSFNGEAYTTLSVASQCNATFSRTQSRGGVFLLKSKTSQLKQILAALGLCCPLNYTVTVVLLPPYPFLHCTQDRILVESVSIGQAGFAYFGVETEPELKVFSKSTSSYYKCSALQYCPIYRSLSSCHAADKDRRAKSNLISANWLESDSAQIRQLWIELSTWKNPIVIQLIQNRHFSYAASKMIG